MHCVDIFFIQVIIMITPETSFNCAVTNMTVALRYHQNEVGYEKSQRFVERRVQLHKVAVRRKKYLTRLRRGDYKQFEWLLEKLNLIYKPPTL